MCVCISVLSSTNLYFSPRTPSACCFEAEEEENTHCKANPSDGGQTERAHSYPLQKGFRVSHLFGASPHISSCSTPGRAFFLCETHSLLLLLLLLLFFSFCVPSPLGLLLKTPSSSSSSSSPSSSPSSLSLYLSTAESRLQNRLSKSLPPSSLCTPPSSLSPETFETVSRTPSLPPSSRLPPSPLLLSYLISLSLSLSLSRKFLRLGIVISRSPTCPLYDCD